MRVLLLGAGHIGQAIARLLSACSDYALTVADNNAAALDKLRTANSDQRVQTRNIDLNHPAQLDKVLQNQEAVINALPYQHAIRVATHAKTARCHYFDLTEDVATTRHIKHLATDSECAFMPQCGLAPGFIGIVAQHLAKQFDVLEAVQLRVGALPAFPTNALKYNLTWSVDGLINEYCHACEAIHDGQYIELLPLEGLEHFSLDGVEYEAFNTSGGLGTLCETLQGQVRNLDYKSVRYPGHCALMKMLLEELQLKSDQETLKHMLRRSVPATMQDVVLVFVTVSGLKHGQLLQEVFARKVFADRNEQQPLSAIQITTSAGVCAALDLFAQGRLPQRGFIRQEQIDLPEFLANRFGSAYQQSRHIESIS